MAPHLTHAALGPPESTIQTASRSVKPHFARLMAVSLGMPGHVISPKKNIRSLGAIWTHI